MKQVPEVSETALRANLERPASARRFGANEMVKCSSVIPVSRESASLPTPCARTFRVSSAYKITFVAVNATKELYKVED
jgi:hypothetical protein